jgi:hypothetical protein
MDWTEIETFRSYREIRPIRGYAGQALCHGLPAMAYDENLSFNFLVERNKCWERSSGRRLALRPRDTIRYPTADRDGDGDRIRPGNVFLGRSSAGATSNWLLFKDRSVAGEGSYP